MDVPKRCVWGMLILSAGMGWIGPSWSRAADSATAADYYIPDQPVTGSLRLIGSGTMEQMAALWSHGFRKIHRQSKIEIECRGSETTLKGLLQDSKALGLMSRSLTNSERERFEREVGMRLVQVEVGHDVLAVVAHPQNPTPGLNLKQAAGILAQLPSAAAAPTWGQLGAKGEWASVPISLHGYNDRSGTRAYLRTILGAAPSDRQAAQQHDSHTLLMDAVSKDRGGIGVVSLSRVRSDRVRMVPLVGTDGRLAAPGDELAVAEGRYPLVRPLCVIVLVSGDQLTDPLHTEFLRYVLSRSGQADVAKDGFLPLTRNSLLMQQDALGWNTAK